MLAQRDFLDCTDYCRKTIQTVCQSRCWCFGVRIFSTTAANRTFFRIAKMFYQNYLSSSTMSPGNWFFFSNITRTNIQNKFSFYHKNFYDVRKTFTNLSIKLHTTYKDRKFWITKNWTFELKGLMHFAGYKIAVRCVFSFKVE